MKPSVARLVLTVALFAGWIGYLAFQVVTRPRTAGDRPLVLSRPQILASRIDVVAEVPDQSGDVTITEVLYPADSGLKPGDKIHVVNIGECHPPWTRGGAVKPPEDWSGPGNYLIPLLPLASKNKYEVAPIPPSPGFPASLRDDPPPPRIYPASSQALSQYRHIPKPAQE